MDDGKICRKCGHLKSLALFHHMRSSEDGRTSVCASCQREVERRHRSSQNLRIALLRSAYIADGPKPVIAPYAGGVHVCDQRIVPMLVSVFKQMEGIRGTVF